MKCGTCTDYLDEQVQTVVCPHGKLDSQSLPVGGPRIPQDQRALIEEAFRMRDQMALFRLIGHGNIAVRAYAIAMTEALEQSQVVLGWQPQETKDE